jgi:phosphate-selective porin OprO/OprP
MTNRLLRLAGAAALAGGLAASAAPAAVAQAATTAAPQASGISQEQALALTARLDALEKQNEALQARVAELNAKVAAAQLPLRGEIGPQPKAAFAGARPVIASADGKFTLTPHVVMQLDAATYDQASPGPVASDLRRSGPALGASASNVDLAHARDLKAGNLFRRARIGVDGKAFGDWQYRILFDFAGGSGVENTGQLYETWIQYDGFNPAHVRVGAFSPSLGLEDQGSTNGMPFLERSAIVDMARGLAGGDTRTAVQLFGSGERWLAAAAVTGRTIGVLSTGTASAVPQSYGDQLGYTARIAGTPLRGKDWLMHLGANGSYVAQPANTSGPAADGTTPLSAHAIGFSSTPEIRVDGTKLINTGNIPARHASTLGAEFALQRKNLLLQAEYQRLGVSRADGLADPRFTGYYLQGVWSLTGEPRVYNTASAAFDAPAVAHPFSFGHGAWGAWELGLRYSDSDLNFEAGAPGALQTGAAIRGGEEKNLTAGLNWYWNSLARVMLDYQRVRIDRLSPASSTSAAGSIWLTPAGAQIGQQFNVWSVRTQFAF